MARRGFDIFTFGGRVHAVVGVLIVVTAAASLFVAFGDRHTTSLFELAALVPSEIFRGQIWRLVTWIFVEPSPLGLLFQCLFLYWFGRDLADEWGPRFFLRTYASLALTAAVATCAVAAIDRDLFAHVYLGGWAIASGLIVAWGLWFPARIIRLWFVIPIKGIAIAWLTVGLTVVFAVYRGWAGYVPELAAEAYVLVWVYGLPLLSRWSRARDAQRTRKRAKQRAKAVAHLRLVESTDDDPPPLPPEVAGRIDAILGGGKERDDDR